MSGRMNFLCIFVSCDARAASLLQDATQESSGPLIKVYPRCSNRRRRSTRTGACGRGRRKCMRLAKKRGRPAPHCLGDGPPELCQDKLLCVGVAPGERRWLSCADVEPSRSRTAILLDAEPIVDWRTTAVNNNFGTRFKKAPVLKATIELAKARLAYKLDRYDRAEHRLKRGRVEDLGPSAMYFVGSRALNETVVEAPMYGSMPARGSTLVQASLGRYALTHLEGNVVRFAPLYEKYNGGKAMSSHWMKNRNATIFEPPHRKRRGRVSQNYRDELQRRRAKKARRRGGSY